MYSHLKDVFVVVLFHEMTRAFFGFALSEAPASSVSLAFDDEKERNPLGMKQFVLNDIQNAPPRVLDVAERTELDCILCAPLKFRLPWNVLLGDIAKNDVCVVGDPLHPVPPDIGQGECLALEGGVILARCLAEVLLVKPTANVKERNDDEYEKMEKFSPHQRGVRGWSDTRERW